MCGFIFDSPGIICFTNFFVLNADTSSSVISENYVLKYVDDTGILLLQTSFLQNISASDPAE